MSAGNAIFIKQAQIALQAGRKQEARHLLQQAVRQNPQDYAAWLWLASITQSPHTALEYVKRAEMLRPDASAVQKARAWAERRLREASAVSPTPTPTTRPPATRWRAVALWAAVAFALTAVLFIAALLIRPALSGGAGALAGQSPDAAALAVAAVADLPLLASQATPLPTATPPRIQAKQIAADDTADEPRPRWTPTLRPTSTPTPAPTAVPTFISEVGQRVGRPLGVGPQERWIDVNLTTQTLTAYEGDLPVLTSLISSGTWQYPTVTGQFRVYLRYESQTMDGRRLGYDYYLEGVPYVMYFYRDYALHGTFWHTNFGTPMSHGCVNMNTPDAQWLFNWSTIGTVVNVHY
jgi:lipoprotein-anchoring transpeptidase ErfK/SrfK